MEEKKTNEILDNTKVINTLNISIGELKDMDKKIMELINRLPKDDLKDLLKNFYFLKVTDCLNTQDYKSIEKLEGILDLINIVG